MINATVSWFGNQNYTSNIFYAGNKCKEFSKNFIVIKEFTLFCNFLLIGSKH